MRSKISVLLIGLVMLLSGMVLPVYAGDATVTDCTNFTGAGTISQAVADANIGGGVIRVTCTGTIIFEDKLDITADVTINNDSGGEVIFDETGDDNRFFIVDSGASLALDGFTLQNGNAENGGAIFNNRNGTLTISNSTFTGNSANFDGGAIFNDRNGTLTISDSTFTDNSADDAGGAIYGTGGTLTISDSTFTDNSAEVGGAIRNAVGRQTINNSTFTNNSADFGGAIFNDINGALTISDSTFTNNSADSGGAIFNGGATTSSEDTHYENNTCFGDITDNGGNTVTNATDCPGTAPGNDDVTISTCDFATLQAAVADANDGGGRISVTCTGAIIFDDELIIGDNVVIQNDSGGEVIFDEMGDDNRFFFVGSGASLVLDGFTLQNGNSASFGGAILSSGGTLYIRNSTFTGNSAGGGGAIFNDINGTLTISDSTFTGNSAIRDGGAIFNGRNATLIINNSTFTNNSASRFGGAIVNSGTLYIRNSTFTDNSTTGDGGAIFTGPTATTSSQNTHYENNTCSGAITDNGVNTVTDAIGCPGN